MQPYAVRKHGEQLPIKKECPALAMAGRARTAKAVKQTADGGEAESKKRGDTVVINEKGLLRAMKEAYKSEGYEIQCKRIGDVKEIHLETTAWRVTCVLKNLPRKVLGLIVEHLGEIPEPGQCLQVKKGEPQMKIFKEDEKAFCGLTLEDSVNPAAAHKTPVVYKYGNIWQQVRKNKVFWIDPELEEIMLMNRQVMCLGEKVLSVSGSVSGVYIKPSSPQKVEDRQMLEYLAGIQLYT